MAMNGRFEQAAIGIFCAMVLDSLDGRVARMTNTQSAFGEQMDSLSDMVSLRRCAGAHRLRVGAARAWASSGWIAAFVYCACAALRLARFNTNIGVVDKRFFQGLPSPAAAALVIGFIWVMDDAGFKGASESGRGCLDGVWRDAVRRADDGDQRAVLQLQGRELQAHGAVHRDRRDRAGHRGDQHPSADRAVRRCSASTACRATRSMPTKRSKGKPVSVIATSTDEPDEDGLHR